MAPMVIDLTSSPEPDESPGKAAKSTLKYFQPRKQKALSSRVGDDNDTYSPRRAALEALEGFQPRKQKKENLSLDRIDGNGTTGTVGQTVLENGYERPAYQTALPRAHPTDGIARTNGAAPTYIGQERRGNDQHTEAHFQRPRPATMTPAERAQRVKDSFASKTQSFSRDQVHAHQGPFVVPRDALSVFNGLGRPTAAKAPIGGVDHAEEDSSSDSSESTEGELTDMPHDSDGIDDRPNKRRRIDGHARDSPLSIRLAASQISGSAERIEVMIAQPNGSMSHHSSIDEAPTKSLQDAGNQQSSLISGANAVGAHVQVPSISRSRRSSQENVTNGFNTIRRCYINPFDKEPEPAMKHRAPFSATEDALLIKLREVDSLTFAQMMIQFPGRSSKSLENRYYNHLRARTASQHHTKIALPQQPSTSRHGEPFSREEDALLARLKEVENLSWEDIAPHFNGRSVGSLQTRYCTKVKGKFSRLGAVDRAVAKEATPPKAYEVPMVPVVPNSSNNHGEPYSPEEDALLVKLKEVDMLSWKDIVSHFPGRTSGSLQVRYSEKLKGKAQPRQQKQLVMPQASGIWGNHGAPYSANEDTLLKKLKEEQGLTWEEMLPHFDGRTAGSLQVRYSTKLKARPQEILLPRQRSSSPDDAVPGRRHRRKRNDVSTASGFISWADVKRRRLVDDVEPVSLENEEATERIASTAQFEGARAYPRSMSSILRQRELGSNFGRSWMSSSRSVPDELKEHVFDDIGPQKYFQGTSGDVTCLAWAQDGLRFAAGSIAITDERSMQYNRPCNLLLGDNTRSLLCELPEHHLPRPLNTDAGNVNSLHSMRETQDPRLFMTVASVQFSPDNRTLYSAGSDRKVRAYRIDQGVERASCRYELEHPAPLDLLSISNHNLLATACHQAADGSIGVYRGSLRHLSLSPSRMNSETERAIYPSALKWGMASFHSNLLLAGFSIDSIDDEREIAGETCLWDIQHEVRIAINAVTRNVFDIAWNPSPSSTSAVFAVASTPGQNKVNKGMRSVVQCFAPNQNRAARVIEFECPAFDINDVVYCPYDDNLIATGATDGKVYVWDQRFVDRGHAPLHILRHSDSLNVLDHDRDREIADTGVRFLSWGATSSRLYSGSSDGVVKIWNTYRATENAHVRDVATFTSAVMSGAFSADYRDLLIGEDQGRINLLSLGNENKSIRAMERFALRSAPAPQRAVIPGGHSAARDLLGSKEIQIRSMGALPVRQAVQGPNYRGPYLAPFDREVSNAEYAYQQALNEQNEAHSHAAMSASQSTEGDQALRDADRKVQAAQTTVVDLQSRVDDSAALATAAEAMQTRFRRDKSNRRKLEASLSHTLVKCKLDCNYLPSNVDDEAGVTDSHRSESRIPGTLWRTSDVDVSTMTSDDLVEAGLTRKCVSCLEPAPKAKKGMPLCQNCDRKRRGLTSTCEICSTPIRPQTDPSHTNLCERCNFACFKCGKPTLIARHLKRISCDSCKLSWEAGVLGYELVKPPARSNHKSGSKVGFNKQASDALEHVEHLGATEIEYQASRWHMKQ